MRVKRPVIPPLLYCALALWAGCAGCLSIFEWLSQVSLLIFTGCGFVLCIAAGLLLFKFGINKVFVLFLGASLGLACAGQASFVQHALEEHLLNKGRQIYTFQIVEDVQQSQYGRYAVASVYNHGKKVARVRVNIPQGCELACWNTFEATCTIKAPSQHAASYYWSKELLGSVSPASIRVQEPQGVLGLVGLVRQAGLAVYSGYTGNGSNFLCSIVFGSRQELFNSSLYGVIKRLGLAHIVAVSGAHLSITIAFCAALLRALRVPRVAGIVVQSLLCAFFVLLTGAPSSALRAGIMAICALFAFFGKRRALALNSLAICIIVFIVLHPFVCLSTSLLLSALSTLGIVLFANYFSAWFEQLFCGRFVWVANIFGMTLAAVLATLPVTASLFGQLCLVAPLSNLFAAPAFVFLCVGGMLCAILAAIFSPLQALAACMCVASEYFCQFLVIIGNIPYAAIAIDVSGPLLAVGIIAAAVLLLLFWPKPSFARGWAVVAAASLCTALCLFVVPAAHGSEIVMLDVGQGDAFIVRSGSEAVLIDTGNNDTAVLKGLARHHVQHLQAIVITHPDSDHCASLPAVLNFVEVEQVIVAQDLLECSCANCSALCKSVGAVPLVGLNVGNSFSWGAFSAYVVSPRQYTSEGGNADSVVLYVYADVDFDGATDASAFFCGDAEEEVLSTLQTQGMLVHADIYKVGHHGSAGACSAESLQALSPKLALISVGAQNSYGHPTQEVLDLLEGQGVSVFRTDELGDVVCKLLPDEIVVQRN